jgi:hypothetical protein
VSVVVVARVLQPSSGPAAGSGGMPAVLYVPTEELSDGMPGAAGAGMDVLEK